MLLLDYCQSVLSWAPAFQLRLTLLFWITLILNSKCLLLNCSVPDLSLPLSFWLCLPPLLFCTPSALAQLLWTCSLNAEQVFCKRLNVCRTEYHICQTNFSVIAEQVSANVSALALMKRPQSVPFELHEERMKHVEPNMWMDHSQSGPWHTLELTPTWLGGTSIGRQRTPALQHHLVQGGTSFSCVFVGAWHCLRIPSFSFPSFFSFPPASRDPGRRRKVERVIKWQSLWCVNGEVRVSAGLHSQC